MTAPAPAAESLLLTHEAMQFHARCWPGGPGGATVVLLPGTGQPASLWDRAFLPALNAVGHTALSVDLPGHPPSSPLPDGTTAEAIGEALAEALDGSTATAGGPLVLVGFSLGAFVAQEAALARPDLVDGLVLYATAGRQDVFRSRQFAAWTDVLRQDAELPAAFLNVVRALSSFSAATLDDDARMRTYFDYWSRLPAQPRQGLLRQYEAVASYDQRLEALAGIAAPTLVVGFTSDLATGAALAREVYDAVPGASYVELDAGHSGPFEAIPQSLLALTEFLDLLSAGTKRRTAS